jgi:hypothetical protein
MALHSVLMCFICIVILFSVAGLQSVVLETANDLETTKGRFW